MDLQLKNYVDRILILGAGASVDYGLPVWKDLSSLIKDEIHADKENNYKYKEEIFEWLGKVGYGKAYDTIDSCIRSESISNEYPEGADIENELFSILKNIFDKFYKKNDNGWIRILNEKILNDKTEKLENRLAFIDFNYDDVLEKNFLNYSYLHPKQQRYNYKSRLSALSAINTHALYPHGKFAGNQNQESHIIIRKQTMKSDEGTHLDVVSCYESISHNIYNTNRTSFELYLMGLGGGLKINMNNINFPINSISTVHVTIKDPGKEKEIIEFLGEKYKNAEIKKYSTCEELIKKCFNE